MRTGHFGIGIGVAGYSYKMFDVHWALREGSPQSEVSFLGRLRNPIGTDFTFQLNLWLGASRRSFLSRGRDDLQPVVRQHWR